MVPVWSHRGAYPGGRASARRRRPHPYAEHHADGSEDQLALGGRRPVFSVEFFPPKDEPGEAELWRAVRRLEPLDPAFVSVTYGAGGSNRDRTIRTTGRIATETTLVPMAHLTAVSHSIARAAPGDRRLRGRGHPEHPRHARRPSRRSARGVGRASRGHHVRRGARRARQGGRGLLRRRRRLPVRAPALARSRVRPAAICSPRSDAGADFAISQLFFGAGGFLRLRRPAVAAGCAAPLLPGIMPLTTVRTLHRGPELSGAPLPADLVERLEPHADDPKAFRAAGMDETARALRAIAGRGRARAALLHAEPLARDGRAGGPASASPGQPPVGVSGPAG